MVDINFIKEKNNFTEDSIKKKQNYIPLYNVICGDCCTDTKLNHEKTIDNILEKISYSNYKIKLKTGETVESFFKFSPIIEPLKYTIGKYKQKNISQLPIYLEESIIKEMDDVNNVAYIDSFFYYLTSILLNKYNFIHGVDFYDTFLGINSEFKYNISDEIETLISNSYFKENHNKLFNIDNDELFHEKPKLNIEDEVGLEEVIVLDSQPNNECNTESVELLYNNENYIQELDSDSSEYSDSDSDEISDNNDSESDCNEDYSDSDISEIDEDEIYLTIKNFPCQTICIENLTETLDYLILNDELNTNEWKSSLFQIIMILITYQKVFDFTHNDLHSNNIMFNKTNEKFLYYKFNGNYYKVPTYNRVYKIIDFGRSIYKFKNNTFFSNSFSKDGDAASQYNCEPYYNNKKPEILPNKSFDLSRLACSLFDYFYDDVSDEKNKCEIAKTVKKWTLDDNKKNILYKKNNSERYPDFKLYKMITRTVHHLEPHTLLNEPIFKKFSVFEKQIKKKKLMNIDEIPKLYK